MSIGQNPSPSLLDPGQIIKRVFDSSSDRVRVDANITMPGGSAIIIDDADDSIKIGNGSGVYAQVTSTNALKIALNDASGNPISQLNPIDVRVSDATAGTAVFDTKYVDVASAGTDDHVYTAVGAHFRLKQVLAAASGLIKLEILFGPSGSLTSRCVLFNGGSGFPNINEEFSEDWIIPAGQQIVFRCTNRDSITFTIYSTIIGELLTY